MKSRSGFTLIELVVVIVVISIIASIAIVGYNSQLRAAHDSKSSVNLLALSDALDSYYTESGSYPVTCGHSASSVLDCSQVDNAYAGMTAPPKIAPGITTSQLKSILPKLGDKFTHPRNPDESPLNHTVANIIQTDSYFLLSMDLVPGGEVTPDDGGGGGGGDDGGGDDGGGGIIITPPGGGCGGISICPPGETSQGDHVQLASIGSAVLGVSTTVTASSVSFANPQGGSNIKCDFQLTGQTINGTQAIQPHQYVLGYVNEETNTWKFYIQDPRPDLNVLNWNTGANASCQAESIGTLKRG